MQDLKKLDSRLSAETLAVQAMGSFAEPYGDLVSPVYMATTFERAKDGSYPHGKKYARDQSPAYDNAEALLTQLEGGSASALFPSGMAAATAVFEALAPGDRILVPRVMYWGLRKWLLEHGRRWGLGMDFYENCDLEDLSDRLRLAKTRLVWVETPANPLWDVSDIAAVVELSHRSGAMVVVDSTVATPVLTRPIKLGADLVMHSATKYLNGHSDVIAGALVTAKDDEFWARVKFTRANGGAILGQFEAWLLVRGMRTLFLRVSAAGRSAQMIAERFAKDPRLVSVLYPGLPDHPGHAIAAKQMDGGFGAMISLRVKGGTPAAMAFVGNLKVFKRATSLGSVESLAEHRASIEGEGTPCPSDLVRLSVGIENVDDLIYDIEQAFNAA